MADGDDLSLDELFERLERMPVPEGYKVEIVEGIVYMSPQRPNHWDLIFEISSQLDARYARKRIKSDVRIDFPGHQNGFASDVTVLREGVAITPSARYRHEDVEFVAEVISKGTGANDYGPKNRAYAAAGVPVYLIVDPYAGRCHVYTQPKDVGYGSQLTIDFGIDIDLTDTVVGITLTTDAFARD
ncbi:Uma2 family endonuclease [Streptomyces sp. JJ66]|nr:Uma2 family endonuclease [Streptomyces sp. JJ66]